VTGVRHPLENESHDWDEKCDVAILGCGAAGMAAAIEAHDAGAHTIIIEKMPAGREGGNTRVSGGIWFDNTSAERAAVYLRGLCGKFPLPEAVVQAWAHETAANTAWLEQLGIKARYVSGYLPEYPELDGSDCYGGYLGVDGIMGGGRFFDQLYAVVRKRGIDIRLDTPAHDLIRDATTGEVLGVLARRSGKPLRIRATSGVVIATGGFENNPEMTRDYLNIAGAGIWGSPAATGDGHRMAQKAGASFWHMGNMMTYVGIKVPEYPSGFPISLFGAQAFIFVDLDGKRFTNETLALRHGHVRVHGGYEHWPTKPMHVLFDESARLSGPLGPKASPLGPADITPGDPSTFAIGWNLQMEKYTWSEDNSEEIDRGWIGKGESVDELALHIDVDPKILSQTIRDYNADCAAGLDSRCDRDPQTLVPLITPPYYYFSGPPLLAWTNGGPRRNEHGEVLDAFGGVIPGLYAAGTASSTYSWCKDGGFHIADALAFGRVAGRSASQRTSATLEKRPRTDRVRRLRA